MSINFNKKISYKNKAAGNITYKKPKAITYTAETRNVESDATDEVNAVIKEFSDKAKAETQLFKENVDANYFTCLYFNNAAQLDEFLQKVGVKYDDKQFISGKAVAAKLGITIETPDRKTPGNFRINKNFIDISLE